MNKYLIGIDEVGRGCLFYDLVICIAVSNKAEEVINEELTNIGVTDSKKISPKKRAIISENIKPLLTEYIFIHVTPYEIDKSNIEKAQSKLLISSLKVLLEKYKPEEIEHIYLDGNRSMGLDQLGCSYSCIIKGDSKIPLIGAASILAKEYRDKQIEILVENNTQELSKYDLLSNKGYPTPKHKLAIQSYGAHPLHRKSFLKKII